MLCPSCNGDDLTERTSLRSTSEPLSGAVAKAVVIDLMSCRRCGAEVPTVRGKRRYELVPKGKLSGLLTELEEARQKNSVVLEQLDGTMKRSQSLAAEIERLNAQGEVTIMEERVAKLEYETKGLEGRRAKLREAVDLIASKIPAR